jgi:hypothetical protein
VSAGKAETVLWVIYLWKDDYHGNFNQLYILWTNADILTAEKMVMMYAANSMSQKWWDAVTVIIWGATAKLVAENDLIQAEIKTAQDAGVNFSM